MSAYRHAMKYIGRLYTACMYEALLEDEITEDYYNEFIGNLKKELKRSIVIGKYIKFKSKKIGYEEFDTLISNTEKQIKKKYI